MWNKINIGYTMTMKRFSEYTLRERSPSSVSTKPLSGSSITGLYHRMSSSAIHQVTKTHALHVVSSSTLSVVRSIHYWEVLGLARRSLLGNTLHADALISKASVVQDKNMIELHNAHHMLKYLVTVYKPYLPLSHIPCSDLRSE